MNITAGDGEAGEYGKLGRLKGCRWRLVPTLAALREFNAEEALRDDNDEEEDEEEDEGGKWVRAVRERGDVAGVEISFEYEKGAGGYAAYLIGPGLLPGGKDGSDGDGDGGEFTHLPLVLTRLPKPLMELLFEYLATTFDTLPVSMGVVEGGSVDEQTGGGWLAAVLEMYMEQTKGRVDKDIALSYKIPRGHGGGIKLITVGLEKGDIARFLKYGVALEQNLSQPGKKRKREDGGATKHPKGPFILAVEKYMESTMGLDARKLDLVKVACGGFVVGGGATGSDAGDKDTKELDAAGPSGRVKIFPPRKGWVRDQDDEDDDEDGRVDEHGRSGEEVAAERFVEELVKLAVRKGGSLGHGAEGVQGVVGADGNGKGKKPKAATGRVPRGRVEIS